MSRLYYDLHIHSCLSPCGDDDATPDSILGMGELNGLNIMALTDHNSCKNCPAFFKAASRHGIIPIAGMELTTAEDIHAVCLFPSLETAMEFDNAVESKRIKIKNRTDIFGNQLILDDEDNIIGIEENLLINATEISLDDAPEFVEKFGGICYPAHIDRQSNGVISVLGGFPVDNGFSCAELHDRTRLTEFKDMCGTAGERIVISSDAHHLWDIKEQTDYFEFCGEDIAKELINFLRGRL